MKKFLKSLQRHKFTHIIVSLEKVIDLNTTTFEDIVGRLKAYKELIDNKTHGFEQENLMYANSDRQGYVDGYSRKYKRGR